MEIMRYYKNKYMGIEGHTILELNTYDCGLKIFIISIENILTNYGRRVAYIVEDNIFTDDWTYYIDDIAEDYISYDRDIDNNGILLRKDYKPSITHIDDILLKFVNTIKDEVITEILLR